MALPGSTKSATVRTLIELQAQGVLDGAYTERQLLTTAQKCTEKHATADTPYGPVVQKVPLGIAKLPHWEICHPMAYLWYMTHISTAFANVMRVCTRGGNILRLVIYCDEMVPGNPFRPEKSRTLMCIYWAFVDWPHHVLTRSFAWPCLSILRSTIINEFPGRMSFFARIILRLFFPQQVPGPTQPHSFERGVLIECEGGAYIVKAVFAGWVADLLGHKEITEWKGYNGNMCCLTCGNVGKFHGRGVGDAVGLDCHECGRFRKRSNEDVFAAVDDLVQQQPVLSKTAFENLQTNVGFNLVPEGILLDHSLRRIYKPVDHCIRDYMHTVVGDGVANTLIAVCLHAAAVHGFALEHVQRFMSQCMLPSKYGKVHLNWLSKNRLKKNSLTSFASTVLTIVPIIHMFFERFCTGVPELAEHLRCFKLLHVILGILTTGPEDAAKYTDTLRRLICEMHEVMVKISKPHQRKPKLHHLHHVVDGILWLGKLISCFVCERKHRSVKDSALHVFRHIEHTVLADVINKQSQQIIRGGQLFEDNFLVHPRPVKGAPDDLRQSRNAVLRCGAVAIGDVVFLHNGLCGRVNMFYNAGGQLFVDFHRLPPVHAADLCVRSEGPCTHEFFSVAEVQDACIWYRVAEGVISVCVPPVYSL